MTDPIAISAVTDSRPEPLVPADLDLRDFPCMPLEVQRLIRSGLARDESPEACWSAVLLWSQSWHEDPGASIPARDVTLAALAGYGRDMRAWAKVRAGALRGWVECSDGRLYHPIVAEKALEAWLEKLAQRVSGGEGNARRWGIQFDRGPIDAQMAEARRLLSALAPDSRALRKRRTAGLGSGLGSGSQPDSRQDRNRQGQGQGQGLEEPKPDGFASQTLPGVPPGASPEKPDRKATGRAGGSARAAPDARRRAPDAATGQRLAADARAVLAFLNDKAGKRFPPTDSNVGIIVARFREGFTPAQTRQVVAMKVRQWRADERMAEYLRPATLFGRKTFSQYVGELVEVPDDDPGVDRIPDVTDPDPGEARTGA